MQIINESISQKTLIINLCSTDFHQVSRLVVSTLIFWYYFVIEWLAFHNNFVTKILNKLFYTDLQCVVEFTYIIKYRRRGNHFKAQKLHE